MSRWLDRLTGRASSDTLSARLAHYPAYRAPHGGLPASWTLAQANANFDHLMGEREHRLRILGELLRDYAIDIAGPLAGESYASTLDALHRWVNEAWPALHDRSLAKREVWLASSRSGREVVYSLVLDLSLFLGEIVVRRRAGYAWAVNLDETDRQDEMPSYKRTVVMRPAVGSMPAPVVLDFEEMVASRYWNPESVSDRIRNTWAEAVNDAVSGAYEAAWR